VDTCTPETYDNGVSSFPAKTAAKHEPRVLEGVIRQACSSKHFAAVAILCIVRHASGQTCLKFDPVEDHRRN
jgi:hypothetical protein